MTDRRCCISTTMRVMCLSIVMVILVVAAGTGTPRAAFALPSDELMSQFDAANQKFQGLGNQLGATNEAINDTQVQLSDTQSKLDDLKQQI